MYLVLNSYVLNLKLKSVFEIKGYFRKLHLVKHDIFGFWLSNNSYPPFPNGTFIYSSVLISLSKFVLDPR